MILRGLAPLHHVGQSASCDRAARPMKRGTGCAGLVAASSVAARSTNQWRLTHDCSPTDGRSSSMSTHHESARDGSVALSRIRRPPALHEWRTLGAPTEPLQNAALLFLHGDTQLHALILPRGVGRYWPLQSAALAADEASALPNVGMLWAVDAVPLHNSSIGEHGRYPRPDLWRAERGRAGGMARRRGPGRRAQHGAQRHHRHDE